MRRAIKLVFHEHRIDCPHCDTLLIYNLTTTTIQLAERTCLNCGKGFVIENNIAKRLASKKKATEGLGKSHAVRTPDQSEQDNTRAASQEKASAATSDSSLAVTNLSAQARELCPL